MYIQEVSVRQFPVEKLIMFLSFLEYEVNLNMCIYDSWIHCTSFNTHEKNHYIRTIIQKCRIEELNLDNIFQQCLLQDTHRSSELCIRIILLYVNISTKIAV